MGDQVPPSKVTAHHMSHQLRLGSNPPKEVDHWFDFESNTYGDNIYRMAAEQVAECLPQAERYWEFQR